MPQFTNQANRYPSPQQEVILHINALLSEKCLGLNGISGILCYLKQVSYDIGVIYKVVNHILENLIDVNGLKGVSLDSTSISPYLVNGTAGVIRVLLMLDSEKYLTEIKELSRTLMVEFAQNIDFSNGMLGIADTLIEIYKYIPENDYLEYAKELIISSSILSRNNVALTRELKYVVYRYSHAVLVTDDNGNKRRLT